MAASSSSSPQEQHVTMVSENCETTCWGCGLHLSLPSDASIFKCGWCGAITNPNKQKYVKKRFRWRLLRDRCIVSIVLVFMLLLIIGGMWAIYPTVFSVSLLCGIFHSTIAAILSIGNISFFSLAAFGCAGTPPNVLWGSYPIVGKSDLADYTFCYYCSKPKSPRTHHCRSCGKCILDMDHHCPFIGNCVGADNHRSFIAFLISALVSTFYASIMSAYATFHLWPELPLTHSFERLRRTTGSIGAWRIIKEIILAFLSSAMLLTSREFVLVYLFISSVSVQIGLGFLLWQQLSYIYEGETYLSHLSLQADNREGKKDCQNLVRFFGFPFSVNQFLPNFLVTKKMHIK